MANTVWNGSDKTANVTLTGSNLIATASAGSAAVRAIDRQLAGKFYWETTLNTAIFNYGVGIANQNATLSATYATPFNAVIVYAQTGTIWVNNVNTGINIGAMSSGTAVCCMAVDLGARLFWARVGAAGNWNNNAANNPATGIGGVDISAVGGIGVPIYPAAAFGAVSAVTANFGDTAFTGAVPAGFTSGFTAGATINTNMVATQSVLEEWASGAPAMQLTQAVVEEWGSVALYSPFTQVQATQVAGDTWAVPSAPAVQLTNISIEQWAQVATTNPQAVATLIALDEWATVAMAGTVVPGGGGPMISLLM